ncbi:MAG: ABC transporter ATP-binding protein [Alphaproteobacteria bacterium]|nr:ABC transporter ATP-binding protein [Alphaproteobacteria bacterium]NCB49778.1 ABC transporter ATP-binding protein [Alphaproteobacteria bacterium]
MSNSILRLEHIFHSFGTKKKPILVLNDVNFSISEGQIVALQGPSGSGKSTLLQIAGLLEAPKGGRIFFQDKECTTMKDKQRTLFRREYLGFVYQRHLLLNEFSALENVMVPLKIALKDKKEQKERAEFFLEKLGLKDRMLHRPAELSGGEAQRVAIARALVHSPKLLLADEPTGNLDPKTSEEVFESLLEIVKETHLAAFIATHNPVLAEKMDRKVLMGSGVLIEA